MQRILFYNRSAAHMITHVYQSWPLAPVIPPRRHSDSQTYLHSLTCTRRSTTPVTQQPAYPPHHTHHPSPPAQPRSPPRLSPHSSVTNHTPGRGLLPVRCCFSTAPSWHQRPHMQKHNSFSAEGTVGPTQPSQRQTHTHVHTLKRPGT